MKGKLQWTKEMHQAFVELKRILSKPPIMTHLGQGTNLVMDCDASNEACGAVLQQEDNGELRVLGYYSACFSREEKNYCVTRRELLAIVKACRHFREFLGGRQVIVRTDHSSLKWFNAFKYPDGQFARWMEELASYDLKVGYRVGKEHVNADALSRRPCVGTCNKCTQLEMRDHKMMKDEEVVVAAVLVNSSMMPQDQPLSRVKSMIYRGG